MRKFGVEEEFQLVDAVTLQPVSLGEDIVGDHRRRVATDISGAGVARGLMDRWPSRIQHELQTELHQEQVEVACPPVFTAEEQLETIRRGRRLADQAASLLGARVVALASSLWPDVGHLTHAARTEEIAQKFGFLAEDQLTCGMHVHVEVGSRGEGIQVLDRIRPWLHIFLAMSSNSPFWYGRESGFSSYRYQSWSRWPTAGPTDFFGSPNAYDCRVRALLRAGAALDKGMIYFDARLSDHAPTVEIRISDVCLDARHAAAVATIARALVETASREWSKGIEPARNSTAQLAAWAWHAARHGLTETLGAPSGGKQVVAAEAIARLLDHVAPVLCEFGDLDFIDDALSEMLAGGTGSDVQRDAFAQNQDMRDVTAEALRRTHGSNPPTGTVQLIA